MEEKKETSAQQIPMIGQYPGSPDMICPQQPAVMTPVMGQVAVPNPDSPIKGAMSVQVQQTGIALHFVACQGARCPLYMGNKDCGLVNLAGRVADSSAAMPQ